MNFNKLITRNLNNIEVLGLILILFSFIVQLVEIDIENESRKFELLQLHEKLDHIWMITSHEYSLNHPEADVQTTIEFKSIFNSYKMYDQNNVELSVWQQLVALNKFHFFQTTLFIIGSGLLIIVKYLKPKN